VAAEAVTILPKPVRKTWDEPDFIDNEINILFASIQRLEAFASDDDARTKDRETKVLEQKATDYTGYCNILKTDLEGACEYRKLYLKQLSDDDKESFNQICGWMKSYDQTREDIQRACLAFINGVRTSSAKTSDQLYAIMKDSMSNAESLVDQYFKEGRLRIGKWRIGYASEFDSKSKAFGAEWTLSARDPGLRDVADQWVFHTHAVCDEALNFTIKRDMGASHIKRAVDQTALGVSINFVNDTEFSRVENDSKSQKGFKSWVWRTGSESLVNKKKRANMTEEEITRFKRQKAERRGRLPEES